MVELERGDEEEGEGEAVFSRQLLLVKGFESRMREIDDTYEMGSQVVLSSNTRSLGLLPSSRADGEFVSVSVEMGLGEFKGERKKSARLDGLKYRREMLTSNSLSSPKVPLSRRDLSVSMSESHRRFW